MAKHSTQVARERARAGMMAGAATGSKSNKTAAGSALEQTHLKKGVTAKNRDMHKKALAQSHSASLPKFFENEFRTTVILPATDANVEKLRRLEKKVAVTYQMRAGHLFIQNVRLSDPEAKDAVSAAIDSVTKSKEGALEFLKSIGVATRTGRVTKRHGG